MFGWQHGCAGFWWIIPLAIFIMIIGCIFMMRGCVCLPGRHAQNGKSRCCADDSAIEILDKRYAQGEIDLKEYEEMKTRIAGGGKQGS